MTVSELKKNYLDALASAYSENEINIIFSLFLEKVCGFDKITQRSRMQAKLTPTQTTTLKQYLAQLNTGQPYQQILGETEFYGLKFFVNEHVLVPRPETEELLELAIGKIRETAGSKRIKILDIGTGSGIIPIVLKKHFPEAEVSAIDLSENALKTAKKNADLHQVEINFIHQDYLSENLNDVYDVIISNPPYIGIDEEYEIAESVKAFEPKMALFSPNSNPLVFYEKIAEDCKKYLTPEGLVFMEINQKLGRETLDLFTKVLSEAELMEDLSGNERIVWGRK
ncbi:peptide chain release factor N(5)-glutamine methyltransferase [Kaistella palustris]|uniref:peptide chain release factor N(5)-glutamine methyltransferase n=1 Tax=Kaistella palustris TaxID=493376 RepID=UPI000410E9A3|nr:peptide chain release factor N(5)-glutamine methyltransferase [Kaistella palustris]